MNIEIFLQIQNLYIYDWISVINFLLSYHKISIIYLVFKIYEFM